MSDKSDKLIGGRYLIVKSLRQTQLCETFIAQDNQLPGNPLCIVKQLKPQSSEPFVLKTAQRLFDNEAKVLYRLGDHPQIPRLLAHLQVGEQFYLVQEFVEGKDLSQEEIQSQSQQTWTEQRAKSFLSDVLETLTFIHQNNVIHRDIKPSNLIRRKDERIVLIDFGAVKEITNMTLSSGQTHIDRTVVVGTPGYMAPEQCLGKPRLNSDIYSLGMTLVHALTGFHPDLLPRDEVTERIIWRDRAFNCSSHLADIVDRTIDPNHATRYQNTNEVLLALKQELREQTKQDRPVSVSSPKKADRPHRSTNWKKWLGIIIAPLFIGGLVLRPMIWHAFQARNYYLQGNKLIREGNYSEAIVVLDRAIKLKPNFPQALTDKGFALGKLGRIADKFAACSQASNIAPDFAEAWNCRGLARFDLKEYEKALVEYDKAIAVAEEGDSYRAWFNKGEVYMKLRQYERAIASTEQVVAIEPDSFLAWTQICQAWFQLKNYQKAQTACDKSLGINSEHQQTIDLAAKIEAKLP